MSQILKHKRAAVVDSTGPGPSVPGLLPREWRFHTPMTGEEHKGQPRLAYSLSSGPRRSPGLGPEQYQPAGPPGAHTFYLPPHVAAASLAWPLSLKMQCD